MSSFVLGVLGAQPYIAQTQKARLRWEDRLSSTTPINDRAGE
jgi:hypothetical protein